MKKLLTVFSLLVTLLLTGCGDPDTIDTTSNTLLSTAAKSMTDAEKDMMNVYLGSSWHTSNYDNTFAEIIRKRIVFGKDVTVPDATKVPFCDVINNIVADESKSNGLDRSSASLNNQWISKYGIKLQEQCLISGQLSEINADALIVSKTEVSKENVLVDKILEDTVIVDDQALLSPEKVRELRVSVKDCKRAANKVMNLIEMGEPLTVKHYNDVNAEILKCEMLKLENDLNK